MPLVVGNLLTDPAANSFISHADAVAFLTDEASGVLPNAPLGVWMTLAESDQESTLVRASRWMADNLPWCQPEMTDAELVRVGHVAARMAVQAVGTELWGADSLSGPAKRYKADTTEVEYFEARKTGAKAGGKAFPWVYPMLRGLLCGFGSQRDVVRR